MSTVATDGGVDILLTDGSTARVRPIEPSDAPALVRMHARLSERTRYLRYFAATPRLSAKDLDRSVNVDHHDREAFVVEVAGEIIAVSQYHRAGPGSPDAEIAFVVEDAYQRRGLGSLLLEHLAAAARAEGIVNFVADVMPVNATMLRLFANAGYPVEQRYVDGVVHLSFPIAPTPRSIAVRREKECRADVASVARLLAPKAVAVYGAREDGTGVGAALLRDLRSTFAGPVHVVHPRAPIIDGAPAVRSISEVAGPVDLAVVAVPVDAVPDVVADCGAAGVHGLVVVTPGYAKHDPSGVATRARLARQVRDLGMRLIGPGSLGVANTAPGIRLNALLAPRPLARGSAALFSQSTALGTALLAEVEQRRLGLSTVVSIGDGADVAGCDLLRYWSDDPATSLVLMYLESWDDPRKFTRVARELARRKPVVAVAGTALAGAGDAGPSAPVAASGGPDANGIGPDERGVSALFAATGVIRVDTVRELFDVAEFLASQPLPAGRGLAAVTNAPALAALAGASAAAAGLVAPDGYPIDLGPAATGEEFVAATRRALADPRADTVVVAYAATLADDQERIAAVARALAPDVLLAGKPMVTVLPGVVDRPPIEPIYRDVEEAVLAIGRVAAYATWRREPSGVVPALGEADTALARRVVATLAAGGAADAETLLTCYGIEVVPSRKTSGPAERVAEVAREVGLPVALRLASVSPAERFATGGTRLHLDRPDAVARAYQAMTAGMKRGDATEVVVQRMVPPGVACLIEAADDPAFGKVIGFGLGGAASDLFGDRSWRAAPLTDVDAASLLLAPRAAPLLSGYRGSPPVDLEALADLLVRIGRIADDHPRLRRLALDPVLARPRGLSVLRASISVGRVAAG